MKAKSRGRLSRRGSGIRGLLFAILSLACGACGHPYPAPGFYLSDDLAQANVLSHFAAEQRRRCGEVIQMAYAGHSDAAIATDPIIHEEKWRVLACAEKTEFVLDCSFFPEYGARCHDHSWKAPTPSPPTLDSQLLSVAIRSADRIRCSSAAGLHGEGGVSWGSEFMIQLDSSPQTNPNEASFSLFKCSQEARIHVRCGPTSECQEISREIRPVDEEPAAP